MVLHGAWVEDKKISVTYHYKGVNDKLKAKLIETAKGLIQGHGFQLIETPYALEGKPRVNWDKGKLSNKIILCGGKPVEGYRQLNQFLNRAFLDDDVYSELLEENLSF